MFGLPTTSDIYRDLKCLEIILSIQFKPFCLYYKKEGNNIYLTQKQKTTW